MFSYFKALSQHRGAWLLLSLSCVGLFATALYFQHGMGLAPCVMCIYERLALLAILAAGVVGMLIPRRALVRYLAIVVGLVGASKGLLLAIEHTKYQLYPAPWHQCASIVEFPPTLPLNVWFPQLFEASASCGKISWQLLGLSMPQWLIGIFAIYLVMFIFLLLSQFKRTRASERNIFRH